MNHFEGDPGLDESLIPSQRMVFDFLRGLRTAIEPGGLLRVDQPDPSQGLFVAQVFFNPIMPPVNSSTTPSQRRSWIVPENLVNQGRRPLAIPSATQMRISASLWTESFQRYASSTPTLKMPPTGLLPIVARYSLALLPLAQGGISPLRACRSANRIGASSPMTFMSRGLVAPPPALGITHESGWICGLRCPRVATGRRGAVAARADEPARGILRVVGSRQFMTGGGLEFRPAVPAKAHAGACPPVDEDPVDAVAGHDLPVHLGHQLEVVRPEGTGYPHLRRSPVTPLLAAGVHGDPVRVGFVYVVVGRMRVGPREDDHAEFRHPATSSPNGSRSSSHRLRWWKGTSVG